MATKSDDKKTEKEEKPCPSAEPLKASTVKYEPKGVIETLKAIKNSTSKLSDLEVYYTKKIDAKQNITKAVVIMYDIFGWNTKNKNVFEFADKIASKSNGNYYVLMADHFRAKPWPMDKPLNNKEEIMKWKNAVATYEIVNDDMTQRILPSLQTNGVKQVCFMGLCWGGTMGFNLGQCSIQNSSNMFVGMVSIHGSRINDDLCQKMKIPVLYCPAKNDYAVEPVKKIFDTKDFAKKCVYKFYSNMFHGFTAGRGDYNNKENLDAVNDAVDLSTQFFKDVFDLKEKNKNDENEEKGQNE